MTINHVVITNFNDVIKLGEGGYWDKVKERPDEQLIETTMHLTLSWTEYQYMLDHDVRRMFVRDQLRKEQEQLRKEQNET